MAEAPMLRALSQHRLRMSTDEKAEHFAETDGLHSEDGEVSARKHSTLSGKQALVDDEDIDFAQLAEQHGFSGDDGRLVVDPEEAKVEYGEGVASRLKLSEDGRFILWPQPTRYPDDPQNWTAGQKNLQLLIVTLAAFVPDFNSSLGIASLFGLAEQYHKSVDHVSSSCNRSIFQLGTSGLIVILLVKRFGRLPILFWSQLIGLGFTIGCTVAPNFSTFAACRILQATFQNAPQVTGLYTICDMYPFHQQARKINMWNFGFIVSPFIGPSVLGFMAPRTGWRWIYGVGCIFDGLVLIIITLFAKETMFDRHVHPIPRPTSTGLRRRVEDLLGVTGRNMAQYRPSWKRVIYDLFNVAWRPQSVLPGIYIFGGMY
ncbi:MFS general substrate transporter, partial [Atractiella rhizophila]